MPTHTMPTPSSFIADNHHVSINVTDVGQHFFHDPDGNRLEIFQDSIDEGTAASPSAT